MSKTEFAEMVGYMRTHQKERDDHKTDAARIKAEHSERAVDKALEQIRADALADESNAEAAGLAVHFAVEQP